MGAMFKGKYHWCGNIGHKSTECKTHVARKPQSNQFLYSTNSNNVRNSNKNGTNTPKFLQFGSLWGELGERTRVTMVKCNEEKRNKLKPLF
jgi:hypothetical protein